MWWCWVYCCFWFLICLVQQWQQTALGLDAILKPGRFREEKQTKNRCCKPDRLLADPSARREKKILFHFEFELYLGLKQKQKVRMRKSPACGREKISDAFDTCDSFIYKNLASLGSWWLNKRTVFKPRNKYPLGSLCWIAPYLCKELSWVKWLWWAFPEAQCFASAALRWRDVAQARGGEICLWTVPKCTSNEEKSPSLLIFCAWNCACTALKLHIGTLC